MASLSERAKQAARQGYGISENIYCRSLYNVHKPDGTHYTVDNFQAEAPLCSCPARKTCKHIGLIQISERFWRSLDRRTAA